MKVRCFYFFQDLAKKAGFVLVDEVKKLSDDNYNVRVILIDSDDDDDLKGSLLTPENIKCEKTILKFILFIYF